MSTLHERLLTHLEQPWEIWAPVKAADVLGPQRLALRAVVELHAPIAEHEGVPMPPVCVHCTALASALASRSWVIPWPCSTILTIADKLGLTQDQEEQHREEDRRG